MAKKDVRVVPTLYNLPGRKRGLPWQGPVAGLLGIILSCWIATEYFAFKLQFADALGSPTFPGIYGPFDIAFWYFQYGMSSTAGSELQQYFDFASAIFVVGCGLSVGLSVLIQWMRSRSEPDEIDLHGSARWGDEKDALEAGLLPKSGKKSAGVYVGSLETGSEGTKALRHDGKEHVLVFAPTRSGKGVGLVLPTLLTWPHSVLVNDIKGENFALTSGYRKAMGQKVMRFDPAGSMDRTVRDLSRFDCSTAEAAQMLVGTLAEKHNNPNIVTVVEKLIQRYKDKHDAVATSSNVAPDNPALERVKPVNFALAALFQMPFASLARKMGYDIALDDAELHEALTKHTFGPGVRFNPLEEIRIGTDKEVQDVQNIATMIVDPDGKGLNDHWAKTGFSLLVGAILHVLYVFPDKTLRGVAAFLSDPSFENPDQMFAEMINAEHDPEGKYKWVTPSGAPTKTHPVVASSAKDMLNKSDNEKSGVLSTTMSFLTLYRDPVVAKYTEKSDFRVDDLMMADDPVSLYMVVPPSDKNRLKPLIRLLVNQIIAKRMESMAFMVGEVVADYNHRLLLLIDEFPALGKMDVFAEALAFMAGYGLKAYLITQDLSQLYAAYTKDESIVSNCHVRIAYAPNKIETAELLSKMTGITTVAHTQTSTSGGRFQLIKNHVSTSEQLTQRPLLTADEAMALPPSDMLIFVAGFKPLYGKKIFYYKQKVFKERAAMPAPARSDIIEHKDILDSFKVDTPAVLPDLLDTAQPVAQPAQPEAAADTPAAPAPATTPAVVSTGNGKLDDALAAAAKITEGYAENTVGSIPGAAPAAPAKSADEAAATGDIMSFFDAAESEATKADETAEESVSDQALAKLQAIATRGAVSDDMLDTICDEEQIAGLL